MNYIFWANKEKIQEFLRFRQNELYFWANKENSKNFLKFSPK